MELSTFQVGMKINIEVERGDENFFFPSKVEDIELGALVLDIPMKGNKLFHIGLDESVKVYFSRGDSFYYFIGIVTGKKYVPVPVLHVKPVSPFIKNQRRDYFRIKTTVKVKISLVETAESLHGLIKDLSGGGALITIGRELKKGDLINIQFSIMSKIIDIKGRVVRVWQEEQLRHSRIYYTAVQFVEIDETIQDEIIKFILAEQRKLIKKGYRSLK